MAGWSAQVALTGRLPGGPLDVPADATADQGEISMTSNDPVHSESEAHSWTIDVADHPTRQDSPEYVAARQKMTEIAGQQPAGVHHYPTPVADIQLVKYDDFQLWVTDGEGNPAAVAPVAQRGSGDASVHVLYATPGSQLARQKQAAESANIPLILGSDHPLSKQAYQNQQ
jgi:hypothetical protein